MKKSKEADELEFEFFQYQYEPETLQVIKESEKSQVALVYHKEIESSCILKQYYQKDIYNLYVQLQAIQHRNLPTIYDVLYYNQDTYVLEEYIIGTSLREVLQEKIERGILFSETEVISIVVQICEALSVLHTQDPPIVHRDIKPENIMMKMDGMIKLIDFDIARVVKQGQEKDTRLLGTEEYASPEHFGYGQTNEKSDLYSMGVLMHELLTGKRLQQHKLVYRGKLRPIIQRCVEIDPEKRYDSVIALQEALEGYKTNIRIEKKEWTRSIILLVLIVALCGLYYNVFWKERTIQLATKTNVQPEIETATEITTETTIPDVWNIYKNEASPSRILRNETIQQKLETLLGAHYADFMLGLSILQEPSYNRQEDYYYIRGSELEEFSLKESGLVVHADGEIECGLWKNDTYYYYAENKERYDNPNIDLITWFVQKPEYPIQFKGRSDIDHYMLEGDYTGESGYLKLTKDNKRFLVQGLRYQKKFRMRRDTEGVLTKIDPYNWRYSQNWENVTWEVKQFYNFLYVKTVSDDTEDEDLKFDGLYIRK